MATDNETARVLIMCWTYIGKDRWLNAEFYSWAEAMNAILQIGLDYGRIKVQTDWQGVHIIEIL